MRLWSNPSPAPASSPRVISIDALRGFDMFWIIGGDALASEFLKLGGWSFSPALRSQLEHVEWEGFRFYDLIFPLFLFLVVCVLPYSLDKYRERPSAAYWRVARRTALRILLGLLANNLLQFDWPNLRVAGVLQRIGICYGLTALIFLRTRVRGQAIAAVAILLGYWGLLAFTPVPGGIATLSGQYARLTSCCGFLLAKWLFVALLYRQKLFLRV